MTLRSLSHLSQELVVTRNSTHVTFHQTRKTPLNMSSSSSSPVEISLAHAIRPLTSTEGHVSDIWVLPVGPRNFAKGYTDYPFASTSNFLRLFRRCYAKRISDPARGRHYPRPVAIYYAALLHALVVLPDVASISTATPHFVTSTNAFKREQSPYFTRILSACTWQMSDREQTESTGGSFQPDSDSHIWFLPLSVDIDGGAGYRQLATSGSEKHAR
ncbi:uncharacterized protein BT62DRAFT_1006322 [Guyanagaster necrorhizus]|uniref:Uncharacterized protein n=1 Tax=Guyanagaster necrorhizus TaxID=856835 RepID=A0A9P7VTG1_9AGAR|nr:uncharacterized protein BT62DRAFT_1006322 [Guyanagaster necrorhizus MCA 3950]KAG7446115.1 hypothetical protein BT62DRAFT_1006322 [Guyanagaster necrorhizus MCA 3950]